MIVSEVVTTVINGKRQFCRKCLTTATSYATLTRVFKNYDHGTTTTRHHHTCANCIVAGVDILN